MHCQIYSCSPTPKNKTTVFNIAMFWSCVSNIHLEYAPLQNKTTQRIRRVYVTNPSRECMACIEVHMRKQNNVVCQNGCVAKKIYYTFYNWKTGSLNMKSRATHKLIILSYVIIGLDEMRLVGKTAWLFMNYIQISLFKRKTTL